MAGEEPERMGGEGAVSGDDAAARFERADASTAGAESAGGVGAGDAPPAGVGQSPESRSRKPWTRRRVVVWSIVAVVVSSVGWVVFDWGREENLWGQSSTERWLARQPLADKHLLGLKLIKTEWPDNNFWLPSSPSVTRVYSTGGRDPEEVEQEIVDHAISLGCIFVSHGEGGSRRLTWLRSCPGSLGVMIGEYVPDWPYNLEPMPDAVAVGISPGP